MKGPHLLRLSAALAVLAISDASDAAAQQRVLGPRIFIPNHSNHFSWEGKRGFRGGFGGVWIVEREVVRVVEVEVPVAAPPPAAPPPPPPPRKPFVIGNSYGSLPDGCMKLIEGSTAYYHCGGEWYRQVASGRYVAVARKL